VASAGSASTSAASGSAASGSAASSSSATGSSETGSSAAGSSTTGSASTAGCSASSWVSSISVFSFSSGISLLSSVTLVLDGQDAGDLALGMAQARAVLEHARRGLEVQVEKLLPGLGHPAAK